MKIESFRIRRFKSLLDVSMDDIGNLAILVGENGSGKTNIFEILNHFFNDFLITGGSPSPVFHDRNAWYRRRPRAAIEVTLTIELDNEETENIFQKEDLLKIMKDRYEEDYNKISVCRQIINPNTPWITKYIRLGKLDIVVDNKIQKADDLNISLEPEIKKPVDKIRAYFFHPKADQPDFSKERFVVLKKKAYSMDEYTDTLVRERKIPYEIIPNIDINTWVTEGNLTLVEIPLKPKQIEPYLPAEPSIVFTEEMTAKIGTSIQNLLKNHFIYIPANRDVKATPNTRVSFIDKASIVDPFCTLSDPSLPAEDEERYRKILDKIKIFITNELYVDLPTKEIRLWEDGSRFPLKTLGGGIQVIIGLMWQIYSASKGSIFAIEEPEIHLHPELSGKLFNLIKDEADTSQIMVVTHIPKFIDQTNIKNNWNVWKENIKTQIKRVQSEKELVEILNKLGARPIDRLYPNKILLSCETERTVLSTLARKLRYNIDGVLIPLESDFDKRKIKIHADFVKDTQTLLVLVLDEHGTKIADEAVSKGYVKKENCYILKGTIEDYYPKDLLVKVLKKLFGLEVDMEELVKPIVKSVQGIKGIPKNWKIHVGKEVATQWSKDIPEIIMNVIEKLAS